MNYRFIGGIAFAAIVGLWACQASAQSGDGADGGNGGNASIDDQVVGAAPGFSELASGGDGAAGGDGSGPDGNGGNGGDGGNGNADGLNATINGPVTGNVSYTIRAGDGGDGGDGSAPNGVGGDGGDGGDIGAINIVVNGSVGGSLSVTAEAGEGGEGGVGPGADGADGADGTPGVVNIVLNEGALMGGGISVNEESSSTLTFNLDVTDPNDYDRARAILGDDNSAGTIEVDGRTYSWSGFDQLVDMLNFIGVREVRISVSSQGTSTPIRAPRYFHCGTRYVVAYQHVGGPIVINATQMPEGLRFHVGTIASSAFESANPLGWTVELEEQRRRAVAHILDGAGTLVATCRLDQRLSAN